MKKTMYPFLFTFLVAVSAQGAYKEFASCVGKTVSGKSLKISTISDDKDKDRVLSILEIEGQDPEISKATISTTDEYPLLRSKEFGLRVMISDEDENSASVSFKGEQISKSVSCSYSG